MITLEVCAGSALAGPEMRTGRATGEKDQCCNPERECTTQNLGPPRADRPAWLSIPGPIYFTNFQSQLTWPSSPRVIPVSAVSQM